MSYTTGHGFMRERNAAGQTSAACTCGWQTPHAYTGDPRFVDAATGRDWDAHAEVLRDADTGTLTLHLPVGSRTYATRDGMVFRPGPDGQWSWRPIPADQSARVVSTDDIKED